jgi:hypothetical protein
MLGCGLEGIDALHDVIGDILACLSLVVTDDEPHDVVVLLVMGDVISVGLRNEVIK